MMELVAMVDEVTKRGSGMKIIPVFLHSSLDDIRADSPKMIEWKSLWDKWTLENPRRINSSKWEAAVKYLRPINGLKGVVYDKLGEVEFRRVITESVCNAVPSEIKFEVSHIQGSLRLCEVIKLNIVNVQQKKYNGVGVVGLYGVGGIGKTSLCRVLCNEFSGVFKGRVCHAELGRKSEMELLQDVLERLTNTDPKLLQGLSVSELENLLNRGINKQPVFLALDNLCDNDTSMVEAERYLSQRLLPGSIVIVAACSQDTLLRKKPYLDESNCMEMPELEVEEAKSLFINSSKFEVYNEKIEQLVMRCVERCRFQKGSGNYGYHYHPLALDVLGRQLRGFDPDECKAVLDKVNEDIFNLSHENKHPIFSILRISFDSLSKEDQLLFMDIALYLPTIEYNYEGNIGMLKWLGMVHGIASVLDVKRRLEILKRRSLFECLGDGVSTRVGMHDLWREFIIAESEYGKIGCRRWLYQEKKRNELFETVPSGKWQNVKRMAILEYNSMWGSLDTVNFAHFPNVRVLKLSGLQSEQLVLNLSGMVHLKSLEVRGKHLNSLIIQGLPKDLYYLSSITLGCFILNVDCYVPGFCKFPQASNVSNHINLQILHLYQCEDKDKLGSNTFSTKVMLNLEVFPRLSHLDLWRCSGLSALSSSVSLTSMTKLEVVQCESLKALPDLRMFPALCNLNVNGCIGLMALSSSVPLTSLTELDAGHCKNLKALPDLGMFPALSALYLKGCYQLTALNSIAPLTSLTELDAGHCNSLKAQPDLGMFPALFSLELENCSVLTALRSSAPLNSLSQLDARECESLKALPDLGMFAALSSLYLSGCSELMALSSSVPLGSLIKVDAVECKSLEVLPDLEMFPALSSLKLSGCSRLTALSCNIPLTSLSRLVAEYCESLKAVPNLGMFPALSSLELFGCSSLMTLSSGTPLTSLALIDARYCRSLKALPGFGMLPALIELYLEGCNGVITRFSRNVPLT